jgi:hypothetical protein
LAIPESRINEPSRLQQRAIEYSDEESFRSKPLAMNPKRFKFHQVLQGMSVGPYQIGFWFQVGDFAGRSMARGRYRRQREYPQPPPPSKNNTTITINRVSIVSPLFGLSILNYV